jgi:hypothetical protein
MKNCTLKHTKNALLFASLALVSFSALAADPRKPAQTVEPDVWISMSESDWDHIWDHNAAIGSFILGKEYTFNLPTTQVSVQGQTLMLKKMALRGLSSKAAKRKSVSVKTDNKAESAPSFGGANPVTATDFNLISMWEDDAYISNKLCYGLMNAVGLIQLKTSYTWVKLKIKDVSGERAENMGLYLATEKPGKVMEKTFKSPFVLRRGTNDKYEVEVPKDAKPTEGFLKQYLELYTWAKTLKGKDLYDKVSSRLDLDSYFKWLAINSLVRNQDAQDEIFFYADSAAATTGKLFLRVFPWDFDDTFQDEKTGILSTLKKLKNHDDTLDKAIAEEPLFQAKYREVEKALFAQLDDTMIDSVAQGVRSDIEPYLVPDILQVSSRLDKKKIEHNAKYIRGQIDLRVQEMKETRRNLLQDES